MKIVKEHIDEAIMSVKQDFPFKIKYNNMQMRYEFFLWDSYIEHIYNDYLYSYNANHGDIFYTNDNILIKSSIYNNLDKAKKFILNHYNNLNKK